MTSGRVASTVVPAAVILVVQQVLFPVPAGVAMRGVMIGLLTAMVSVGMALVYRANRILNFAQADLGYVPASLAVMLVVATGLPWAFAFGAGLASAVLLGALCELAIIRRFFRADRLVLTVATLGLSQLLAFGGVMLPRLFGEGARSQRVDPPFTFDWEFGGSVFNANHLLVLVVAPVAILAVGLFLQRTRVGVAIRAAADRPERASLLGVPVKNLQTIVWAVAGGLAYLGLFLRAGTIGLPIGAALTFGILLRSLAALMLGRMTDLPAITLAAVAIGLLEVGVDWNGLLGQRSPLLIEPVVAIVASAALLVRRRGVSRLDVAAGPNWTAADEARPFPTELRRLPEVRAARLAFWLCLVMAALVVPHVVTTDVSLKLSVALVYALVVCSVVVVTGWAGQVSLAQVAFMAVGAAVAGIATSDWGLDLSLALVLAGLAGLVAAVVVGLPALRLDGLFLAVTTLGFGLATSAWLLNPRFFDWVPRGRIERPDLFGAIDLDSPTRIYYLALGVLALVVAGLRGIRASRTGRVLLALRDNEQAVQSYGVSVARAKLTAFAISGFVAAVAGGVFIHHQQAYDAAQYGPELSIVVFTAAVIGGLGTLTGGLIGAAYVEGGFFLLPSGWRFLSSSMGVMFVLLVLPGGLASLAYRLRDLGLRWVATRRRIAVPSLVADVPVARPAGRSATTGAGEQLEPIVSGRMSGVDR